MKHLSPCSAKRFLACLVALALLCSGCSTAPGKDESVGTANETPVLPEDYQIALSLMQSGDYPTAIVALQRFISSQPELAGPFLNLGIAYRITGDTEAALDALNRSVELNPASAPAYQELGILYRERGQFDAALDAYDRALKLDPGYALAHRNIGILYDLYLQRPGSALEHYRKYLELVTEDDPEISGWIADLERRSGSAQAKAER